MTPPTGQPSDADLARWEADHRPYRHPRLVDGGIVRCIEDDIPWPCQKARLIAAVRDRDARIAAALEACDYVEEHYYGAHTTPIVEALRGDG